MVPSPHLPPQTLLVFLCFLLFPSLTAAQTTNPVVGNYDMVSLVNRIYQSTDNEPNPDPNIEVFNRFNKVEHGTLSLGEGTFSGNIITSNETRLDRECGLNCNTDKG